MLILNDENFEKEILENQKTALVDYYADWCFPCRMLSPILEKLSKEYKEKILFAKLNVDFNPITSQKYGITNLPTVVLFKNGKPVSGFIGARTEEEIKKWLAGILETNKEEEAEEKIEELVEKYEKYAEENGFKLNPNKKMVEAVIKGLLEREEKFGFRYCPCRRITENQEEDKKIICPCEFMRKEIEEQGHCLCGLFFAKN